MANHHSLGEKAAILGRLSAAFNALAAYEQTH